MIDTVHNSPSIPSHISLLVGNILQGKYEDNWNPPVWSLHSKTRLDPKHTYFIIFGANQTPHREEFFKSFKGNILYTCKAKNGNENWNVMTLVVFEVEDEVAPWGKTFPKPKKDKVMVDKGLLETNIIKAVKRAVKNESSNRVYPVPRVPVERKGQSWR